MPCNIQHATKLPYSPSPAQNEWLKAEVEDARSQSKRFHTDLERQLRDKEEAMAKLKAQYQRDLQRLTREKSGLQDRLGEV